MKLLKRIKWLITKAPTMIEEADKAPCHYCGELASSVHWHGAQGERVICHSCFITAMDKVMQKKGTEKEN